MASNYCNYNYGNSSYPQNQQQSFSDQYPSTAPAAGTAPQTSQKYYSASQSQPRQTASAVRQSVAADSRSNTTQYNGLHFPAPAPARQTVAPTSHDIGHLAGSAVNTVGNSGGGSRSNASAMGGASGYGSAGHYQPASKQSASQPRQRADAVTGRAHDRAEHALSASTGWNTGTGTTSSVGQAAPAAANVHYGYSYSKPSSATSQQQQSQQNNYYAAKRASATSSNNAQKISSNNSASRSSSATSNQPSQGHLNQGFGQPAQTSSKSSYSYEPPSVKTNPSDTAPEYQQTAEYGKTYSDDADQNQSYLHRVYTLPQPTPTRNATDNSNSYFPNTHATETSYNPSSQTLNSSTMVQTASYSKPAQDLGRASSATTSASSYNYGNIASTPGQPNQQQYYQHHGSANAPQHSAASYNNVAASIVSTTPTAPIPTPEPVSVPQPPITPTPAAKKPRKSRQSLLQKSPAKKVPKSRTPKKSNGTAASSTITEVTGSQRPESLPAQHTFYPSDPKAGKSSTKTGASQRAAMNVDLPPEQSLSPDPLGGPEVHTMEQHMREMVEKMREYQSKDPTAFQQVWENVKRGNPPAAGGKGAASISSMGLKGTPGIDSPRQVVANLAKPPAAKQPAPVAIGKQNPPLGNAASQAQRTVWPSSQKIALSQTVSTFLSSSNQSCSESYVMSLLDYGPTFTELCQKLENHGYRFERNDLAQELLKTTESVDPSKAASTASPAISAAPPSSDVPSRAMTPQSMKSFNPRNIKDSITNLIPQDHHHDHSQNFVAPSLIYREVSYPTHFGQPESNVRSDEPAAPPTPFPMPIPDTHTIVEKPAQEPGKKRVSLAKKPQKSSSSKVLRTPHPQAPQALQTAHPGSESQAPVAPQPSFSPAPREEPMPDASPLTITITQPISRYENLIQAATPRNSLVQPQGHDDNSALEKLQSKLEAQMSRLKRLEEPVELLPPPTSVPAQSTPQPPPPPPPPSRKPAWPRAPIWDRKDALRRNTYDPRTIVHDVLQATGRHPQYEGLNSGLAILKRLHPDVFDSMTDLAAIPWDIYDPPPAPLPGEERKPKKSIVLGEEETRGRKREPVPFKGIPRTEPIPSIPALMPEGKVRGKRGRPRGSRGTPRSARGGRGGATAGGPLETSNTATNSAGDPSTAANAHQYGTVTRVNINTLRNGGSASSSRGDSGRKRKYGDSPDPHYPGDGGGGTWGGSSFQTLPAFKCQWEKCNQELQNLETLRKHLVKKHKAENIQGVLPCCWGDCGTLVAVGLLDSKTGKQIFEQRRRRLHFGSAIAWDSHVLGEHLKVVRDELGDGMSVSAARSLSRDSSAHSVEGRLRSMSLDRAGRSLTPVITQAPHGYKFTPPPGFSGGTQFKLAHEFPEEIDIKTDADERKFFEDELARIGRMGAGTESFNIPDLPGLEFDSTEGWAIKTRKLTTDFSKVAPLPPQGWNESGGGSGEKGKG
ncbi:hypothetical protein TWF106_008036 [Orbilia oligospora]|uniref:C2H2-type domain-containing protein n=1 Tax=Orbilia oligospora TaxID=2813651 RepID=A0A7C8UKM3_ORBOL|nr:hypothetical protein TWF106_008036 [Orbilia oligospora]